MLKVSLYEQNHPMLGMDAEIVPRINGVATYPHLDRTLGQKRYIEVGPQWQGGSGDWHGDGFAYELCVQENTCLDVLMERTAHVFSMLRRNMVDSDKVKDVDLWMPAVYDVPIEVVEKAPMEVRRLGCAPSFNIYNDAGIPERLGANQRTTGFHMHMSGGHLNSDRAPELIKWADIFVGSVWTWLELENPDHERLRRQAYGRAGEHRRNIYPNGSYGIEYRVLPGLALRHPALMTLMFRLYRCAYAMVTAGEQAPQGWIDAARSAINNADAGLAGKVVSELEFSDIWSRKLLNLMKSEPPPALSLNQWIETGNQYIGCVNYARDRVR